MFRALPPLTLLIAFEAAARQGSFQEAAAELHLTPSAISHRIKSLETDLGKTLFERRHRQVVLTPDGKRYYTTIHDIFQRLHDATEHLRAVPHKHLRLSVAPAIGSKWLMTRLTSFQATHPEIEFELSTSTSLGPLLSGEADLGLRYGEEEWPGLHAWKLFDEVLIPVCSPDYAATLQNLPDPTALQQARLLRHPLLPWQDWFNAVGLNCPESSGPRYEDALLMLEAAATGQGVALITATLATSYLQTGILVQPVPLACPGRGFYAVAPSPAQGKPWVMRFIRWLVSNARTASSK